MLLALLASLPLSCAPVTQKVLVFNIEYGGDLVDFGKTVEVIERAAPDLVLIEEAWGHIPRLAQALGWREYDTRYQALARRPLLDPAEADGRFFYVEASPGCVIAVANVHLPSDPEPPEVTPEGAALASALEVERTVRLRALQPTLAALRPLLAAGVPALLGGDFNTPSHLDEPPPWPVSLSIAEAGLRDVWREAHPDRRTHPGYTWWAARPQVEGWNPPREARQRRIDQLHAGGSVRVREVRIVGEAGREGIDIGVTPWPSDHRALLATLEVTPARAPPLVVAWPPRVPKGESLRVRARGAPPGARVVLAPVGAKARDDGATARAAGLDDLELPTKGLSRGAYVVALLDASGREMSRAPFWVAEAEPKPEVLVEHARLEVGEGVDVRWTEAPGCRWDWVGVYPEGGKPGHQGQPLVWRHTRATVAGSMRLDATAEGEGWPLHPGAYSTCLFEDDAYAALACARFDVVP